MATAQIVLSKCRAIVVHTVEIPPFVLDIACSIRCEFQQPRMVFEIVGGVRLHEIAA